MVGKELNLVILGAAGFVGQALLKRISVVSDRKFNVTALIRNRDSIMTCKNINMIEGSMSNIPEGLFPSKPHVVIHFAVKNTDKEQEGYVDVNVDGTKSLLTMLPKSCMGIIYGSSFSVYGQGNFINICEREKRNPKTPLAVSRGKAENLIVNEMKRRKQSALLLRPRFIVGSNDKQTIPSLLSAYRYGISPGTGKQVSAYIEVEDYGDIIIKLAELIFKYSENKKSILTPVNIGYKNPLSLHELHSIFSQTFGYKKQIYLPQSEIMTGLLHSIPSSWLKRMITKIELAAFSHTMDVSLLESLIGNEITKKDPAEILADLMTYYKK